MRRAAAALALAVAACAAPGSAAPVEIAAGLDHSAWDRLLRKHVDERGSVDYRGWKASADDRRALAAYLDLLARPARPPATGADRHAALVNAYNALTVAWVLEHHPVRSIRDTDDPWKARRHRVGGRLVSLDEIEHDTLRPGVGYRVHAVLVCAARSCPPLAVGAYRADRLEEQLDQAMARWLGREDLNRFEPAGGAQLSEIFRWYAADFEAAGGVRAVVLRHGPPAAQRALGDPAARVSFLDYDWALNER